MGLRALLWNRDERRLRAGWRLLLAVGFVGVPTLLATVGLVALVGIDADASLHALVVSAVATTVGSVVGVWAAARVLDRRPFRAFGFHVDRSWWRDFAFGLGLGAVLVTGVVAVELAAGWATVTGVFVVRGRASFPASLGLELLVFCCVALYEELLARGYLLRNVAEGLAGLGRRHALASAVVVSSAIFSLGHVTNPAATAASAAGVFVAGSFLAVGYVLTDELALPVGAHLSWNAAMGAGYGLPVSGLSLPATVVAVDQRGPVLATGGQFGPEAGLLGAAAALIGVLACVWWARRTGSEPMDPSAGTV